MAACTVGTHAYPNFQRGSLTGLSVLALMRLVVRAHKLRQSEVAVRVGVQVAGTRSYGDRSVQGEPLTASSTL